MSPPLSGVFLAYTNTTLSTGPLLCIIKYLGCNQSSANGKLYNQRRGRGDALAFLSVIRDKMYLNPDTERSRKNR